MTLNRDTSLQLTILAALLYSASAGGQTVHPPALDAAVERSMKAWRVPGVALAVVQNDKVVYLKGYGVRELGKPAPVTPDTQFAIASTTKAFTTAALAILADDGKVQWDDLVRKHLPYFRLSDPLADRNVTLRDLVSHRTGLSRHDLLWSGSPWQREEIVRRIGFVPLTEPFRSKYQYQNIMFIAAGEAIAAASGQSWEDFLRARVLMPLGMKNTNFRIDDAQRALDHSSVHIRDGANGAVKVSTWSNVDNVGAAGCINSSVRDLANWVRLQLARGSFEGRRIVSEKNLVETHTPQTVIRLEGITGELNPETAQMSYGLGWTVSDYRGQHIVSHAGSLKGYRSQVALLPKKNTGMVILSNLGQTQLPEALRNALIDEMLDLPKRDWDRALQDAVSKQDAATAQRRKDREAKRHKESRPSRELAAYAGRYEHPGYGLAEISAENGSLVLNWSNFRVKLAHFHFDTFDVTDEGSLKNTELLFRLNGPGDVAGFRMLEVEFTKR